MKFLKHIITAAFVTGVLSVSVFADDQKNNGQKPPKKPEVVERPEKQRPPRNENRGGDEGRGRGNNDNRRNRP